MVKIFFAAAPFCAGPDLWRDLWLTLDSKVNHDLAPEAVSPQVVKQTVSHIKELLLTLDAVHDFMVEHKTENREEADWVYLPAYFPLMFWYESTRSLDCIRDWFSNYDWGDSAGYDHIINYGHEFPHWKPGSILLNVTNPVSLNLDD